MCLKNEITQYVLLSSNGNLFVGTKLCFLTNSVEIEVGYSVMLMEHDGWILEHPIFKPSIYMNRDCEKFLKVLGEL